MVIKDSVILETLQNNSNAGGDLLFERYYKPLVLFADSMITNLVDSEDLVQDVFYRFIKGRVYLSITPEALSTYLFRAVKNACVNMLHRKRMVRTEMDLLRYDAIEEECRTIDPELITAIYQAIGKLPDKTRIIVQKVLLEGKKYKEVAEECEVSVNTVKTLLNSGLRQLRSKFPNSLILLILIKVALNVKK